MAGLQPPNVQPPDDEPADDAGLMSGAASPGASGRSGGGRSRPVGRPGGAEGQQSSPEQQLSFAREIALRLLTARARSRDELRSALAKRQVPQSVIDQMLERFGEVGLVDDAAFAQAWVESGVRRGRSRRAIAQELRRKGIDDGEARQALDALPADSDYDAALELARRRARTMGGLDRQVAYRRLAAALARRGFSSDVCLGVVRQVLGESGDDG